MESDYYQQTQTSTEVSQSFRRQGFAVASLWLGIITLAPLPLAGLFSFLGRVMAPVAAALNFVFNVLMIFSPLIAIAGIILGILGLKSAKRTKSIWGIIFNSTALLLFVLLVAGFLLIERGWFV